MAVEIAPFWQTEPTATGALVVRELRPGHSDVRFLTKQGPLLIYSSDLERGDDFERAMVWAMAWAESRRVARIYVDSSAVSEH